MKQYRIYLLHAVLQSFTEQSFYVFGSLLFYLKTGSVINTLFFGLTLKLTAVIVKSVFVKSFLQLVKSVGVVPIMIASLFLWSVSLGALFFIHADSHQGLVLFFLTGVVYSIGHSGYWMLSNAFGFSFIGLSKVPGRYSAYWQIAIILATLSASVAGLLLHLDHNFLVMLFLMGIMLVISIIPLRYIDSPPVTVVSFTECIQKISTHGLLSNINPEQTMRTTAVPLIILFTFGSLSKSIWISVVVAVVTMTCVYLAGRAKDHQNNITIGLAGVSLIIGILLYGFIHSPLAFVLIGILVGVSLAMVDTAREAGAGRELTNNRDAIAGTIAIEWARSFGGFIGMIILIIAYLITGTLWQPILVVGAFTLLPKISYAIKNIQSAY